MGSNIKLNKWKCRHCNNVFNTKMSLYEHMHIMHPENCFKTKHKDWICQYCNQIFYSRRKLYKHYKDCEEKAKLPHDSLGKIINYESKRKATETLRQKIKNGEIKYKGHSCSADTRAKLAENMQKRRKIQNFQCNYNETACKFIDELNIKNNWHLQHAMNGGEIHVGPYSLDGYDKNLNIAFEYDENKHKHTSLKGQARDKYRQLYIIEQLNCEFWRYSEKENLLYKINKEKTIEDIKQFEINYPNIIIKLQEKLQKIKIKTKKKPKIKKESIYPKDKSGKGNPNIISEEIWIERKNLILNCGIDLMKFGWVGKVKKLTGLTQRELENTLKHFNTEFEGKYFRRK